MTEEATIGKEEFALVAPGKRTIVKRSKPVLVQLGNRLVPSDGRFHPELAAEFIRDHGGRERWIPTGELARVFYGGNTPSNKKRVRHRLFRIWRALLDLGFLLVVEVDARAGAQACKIYDPRSRAEREYLHHRLERMEKQKFLKADQFQKAVALAECLDAAINEDERNTAS